MSRLRDVLLVALDAADWSEYMAARDSLDAAIGEILRLENEIQQARDAYDALRSLFVPDGAAPARECETCRHDEYGDCSIGAAGGERRYCYDTVALEKWEPIEGEEVVR